jgi:aspartyl-tRNA(Asn)/glutamyl-tRNA(Gln) amidotransferase subunit C
MSKAPDLKIDHLAKLARLALSEEEKTRYAAQISGILSYIETLNEVDVSGVEPTAHAFPLFNVWREDKAEPGLPVEKALQNAPAQRDNMVSVPKVVE